MSSYMYEGINGVMDLDTDRYMHVFTYERLQVYISTVVSLGHAIIFLRKIYVVQTGY